MLEPNPRSKIQTDIEQSGKEFPDVKTGLQELREYLDVKGGTETDNGYDRRDEDRYIRLVDRISNFIDRMRD